MDKPEPPKGNVINITEVERYHKDCRFVDRMHHIETLVHELDAEGIGTFAFFADDHMAVRFVTDIRGDCLVDLLGKFFKEQPEVYKALLIEDIAGKLYNQMKGDK